MKFVTEVKFPNKDTADISSLVELAPGLCNYSNELKIRYTFIIEETLLDRQESFDTDATVTFARYEDKHFFRIVLSVPGEKHNALADNTSRDVIEALTFIENFTLWGLIILPCLLGTLVFSFPVFIIVALSLADEILIFPLDHLRCIRGHWLETAKQSAD